MTVQFTDPAPSGRVDISHTSDFDQDDGASIYRRFGKRAFDIAFVLLFGGLGALCVLIAALATILGGHAPFYVQKRVGRGGRIYKMVKIQTMVPNADAVLAAHLDANPAARREWDEKQKLDKDPRVTFVGNILRKTSMDEMPQLWNVLKGDMSIVGPRPILVEQTELYSGTAYYELRPGITGNWQITDRSKGSFAGRATFDADYNRTLSLKNDIAILIRTVRVVLNCTGT